MNRLDAFRAIWSVDFEYQCRDGGLPNPVCMVAREYRSGHLIRLWAEDLKRLDAPPFPIDDGSLFVAYSAPAELSCFQVLGWPMPTRILDLYVEFRNSRSGKDCYQKYNLLACQRGHGLPSLDTSTKEAMRSLAMRGGSYTAAEKLALLDYCQTDVDALVDLLPRMIGAIDTGPALWRGRYMTAVAVMERNGTPIDTAALDTLIGNWHRIQGRLILQVDSAYGVYEGTTFKKSRFTRLVSAKGIPWPLTDGGQVRTDRETFRAMVETYPELMNLYQLRETLAQLRTIQSLSIGPDGRNRTSLGPFGSKTGRNQPSTTKFVYGLSAWLRGLIKPADGRALAYIDWSQQEFGIAAALSGDAAMLAAYASGDPYLEFAKQSGMAPLNASKATHKRERDLCKACILGVQYGMAETSLARRIASIPCHARQLLTQHRETYPVFWRWSDAIEQTAMLTGRLSTSLGWWTHAGGDANPRSLRNFPMQATGAELLRYACCEATERGIMVCAPVHDAVLVEASMDEIEPTVQAMQAIMASASRGILKGFELRTDAMIVRSPDRYADDRGKEFWEMIWKLVNSS